MPRILKIMFIVALLFTGLPLSTAQAWEQEGDYSYMERDGTIYITDYTGTATDISIPSTLAGKPVTRIESNAFFGKGLTSVLIPDSVTSIGPYAFINNQLKSVEIPPNVSSIEDYAFAMNGMTEVTFRDGLRFIGMGAFSNNQLQSVTIPKSVVGIYYKAFKDNQLNNVTFSKGALGLIDTEAFANNHLAFVKLPDMPDTITIGNKAFYNNSLGNVILTKNAKLGTDVFYGDAGTIQRTRSNVRMIMPQVAVTDLGLYTTLNGHVVNLADYKVAYNGNGSTAGALPTDATSYDCYKDLKVLDGGSIAKTGYNFVGWNTQPDGSGTGYTAGTYPPVIQTQSYSTLTLYAQWKVNRYTVAFDAGGGTAPVEVTADYGTKLTAPAEPTRTNYSFVGWYRDPDGMTAWDFANDTVPGDMSLYAKWEWSGPVIGDFTFNIDRTSVEGGDKVRITGTLKDASSNPVPNAVVNVISTIGTWSVTGGSRAAITTEADGTFSAEWNAPYVTSSSAANIAIRIDGTSSAHDTTVQVSQSPRSNANLSALALSLGALDFSSDTTSYALTVGNSVRNIEITPTLASNRAKVTVNGKAAASGEAVRVSLYDQNNFNVIPVIVTAEDGVNTRTYTIKITRENASTSGDYVYFLKEDDTIKIIEYKGDEKNVEIPGTFDGWPVSEIGNGLFWRRDLTGAIIPDSVTEIGIDAFKDNQLTNIKLPASLISIGNNAFSNNHLSGDLKIPDGLKTIGHYAFSGNQLTGNLSFPDGLKSIGVYAFSGNQLTGNLSFPDGMNSIGSWAFANNQFVSVSFPGSLKYIYAYTFYQNNLEDVTFRQSGLVYIGEYSFAENRLTTIFFPGTITSLLDKAFYNNNLVKVTVPKLNEIGSNVFSGSHPNANLTIVTPMGKAIGYAQTYGHEVIISKYQIKYDGNGKTSGPTPYDGNIYDLYSDVMINDGGIIKKDGYTFKGWNSQPDRSGTHYDAGKVYPSISFDQDVMLYAEWEPLSLSSNANLSNLTLNQGELTPLFSEDVKSYSTSVGNDAVSISVTPTLADSKATMTVNGSVATNGVSVPVTLDADGVTEITVVVTAQSGATKTYSVTVTQAKAETYTIASLADQTLTALTEGYVSGSQETKTITVTRTGTGDLKNLAVAIGGTNAADFEITSPAATTLNAGTPTTTFTVKAKDGLAAGTYAATVSVSADNMTKVTFTVKQVVDAETTPTPTYTIASLADQTLTAFKEGYASGSQETKSITVTRTGTGDLNNLAATLSGTNAADFEITSPAATTLNAGTPSTTFTVKAKDGLATGTYVATVTVSADNMTSVTFTVKQIVDAATTPTPTYTIASLADQTLTAFKEGYASGSQETKTITVTRTGTSDLNNLAATLSGTNAADFEITSPAATTLNAGTPSTTFTVKAKDGLAAGTYVATVTVSADNMTNVTFTVKQVVDAATTPTPTYTIASLADQTLTALTEGYASGSQETKTITVTRTGTGDLNNLAATISGMNAADFEITSPATTTLNAGTPSTTFTVKAKDGLMAGTYAATVTVSADNMTSVTFTVKQIVDAATTPTPTYTIASLADQTLAALTEGYASGSQETKTITVTRTGTGDLNNLAATLSGTNAADFEITSPATTLNAGTPSTTFTVKAKDGLATGTYVATVTVSADNMTNVTFTVKQVVSAATTLPVYYPVSGVTLDPTSMNMIAEGNSETLHVTVYPSYATNSMVIWSSSNPAVAKADPNGVVTPLSEGEAIITVTTVDGGKTATTKVMVEAKKEEAKLLGLEATRQGLLLKPNKSAEFQVFALFSDGKREEITFDKMTKYKSNSTTKASVKPGKIKAGKKEGEANIIISYLDQRIEIFVMVSKAEVKELSFPLEGERISLVSGESKRLEVRASLSNGKSIEATKIVEWSSDDSEVVSVKDGKLTAITPGTATILAAYGDKTAILTVEVTKDKQIKRISVNKRTLRLTAGQSESLKLTAYYQDGTKELVEGKAEWSSSDEQIVTVSDGLITAVSSGTANIRATFKGKSVSIKVTVMK